MFKNFIKISIMNIKKNKNIFFNCIFLIIFLFMIMGTFSIKKTLTKYIINDNTNNFYHRSFLVWSDSESLEEVEKKLSQIKEINQVSQSYEFNWQLEDKKFVSDDYNGSLNIKGLIPDNLPDIVDGDLTYYDVTNDGIMKLVCPTILRPDYVIMYDKNWKNKEIIDTKTLLNKMSIFSDKIDIPYKIIATYDTSVNNGSDNECYVYPQNITNAKLKIDGEVQKDNYVVAIVDKYENINEVLNQFNKYNLNYVVMQETSDKLMEKVMTVGIAITITVLIISIFILFFNNRKLMNARKQEFYLYRVLGYDFKKIKSILIIENIIISFLSWICAVILVILALNGFQYYLLNSVVANARIIVYTDYLSLLLSLIISILLSTIVVVLSFNRNNHNLISEIKQEN